MRESLRTCATLLAANLALFAAISFAASPVAAQTPAPAVQSAPEQPAGSEHASTNSSAAQGTAVNSSVMHAAEIAKIIERIAASGRVLLVGETSSWRLNPATQLAPGAAPILTFRYLDGQARHRFGDLDLVMDDAGH